MFDAIPAELRACPQWLLWRRKWLEDKQKWTKQPLNAGLSLADVTQPGSWCDFPTACRILQQCYRDTVCNGVGFVLGYNSNAVGVDLDRVLTDAGQVLNHTAHEVADKLNSYTELSPSGTGLHVLCRASLEGGYRHDFLEVYGQQRFFTMTGNSYGAPRPFADRQPEIDDLVGAIQRLRAEKAGTPVDRYIERKITDEQLGQTAVNAANGEKFYRLWCGQWHSYYGSQSEADFALIDILAYYTDAPQQVYDMFMRSALAQRDKAQRPDYVWGMIQRSFDRKPPVIDVSKITMPAATPVPMPIAAPQKPADADDAEEAAWIASDPFVRPPGLVGDIAEYVLGSVKYGHKEIAIGAALTFTAGIVGRQFQVSETGLNLFTMVLAETGAGKEAITEGLARIIDAVANPGVGDPTKTGAVDNLAMPAIRQFRGADDMTGKGLTRMFAAGGRCLNLSAYSVLSEFAYKLKQMSDPRNTNVGLEALKAALLQFYTKSAAGASFEGTLTADKKNDIEVISSPAFSFICESTTEGLYGAMSEDMIRNGFLPRMIVIEVPDRNRNDIINRDRRTAVPDKLRQDVAALAQQVILLKTQNDARFTVLLDLDAAAASEAFERMANDRMAQLRGKPYRDLWNRAHLNTLRVAAVVAVGCDRYKPTITEPIFRWAAAIVMRQIIVLSGKFRRGEVGDVVGDNEHDQHALVGRCIDTWVDTDPSMLSNPAFADARRAGVIPWSHVSQTLRAHACFRKSKFGATEALKRAVTHFVSIGRLRREILPNHAGDFYRVC